MDKYSQLRLTSIKHSFDNKTVLANISIDIEDEKVTAILGKSGSGKTTLLQIVNGMIKPDSGQVKLFGESIQYDYIHALRLKLGYVVQQVALFPHLTIQSNITLLGKITKMSSQTMYKRVLQLIEMMQLSPGCLSQFPHQLSGGEQQRVGLCRAMFLNPPVLLMDEPFASLDYETKSEIYKHLAKIQQTEPRTIVMVTHDWEEALKLADRFIWMKDGTIKEQGDKAMLEELKSTYLAD
ncbi:MAG: ATP-binding cassette domain-containing protein [Cyclobacteriaceae bacterium]